MNGRFALQLIMATCHRFGFFIFYHFFYYFFIFNVESFVSLIILFILLYIYSPLTLLKFPKISKSQIYSFIYYLLFIYLKNSILEIIF